ncbi:hypothetical protein ABT121_13065 [Streptomyces sp. NPDC001928]|uniref:hypothetical protein n=1 Tax=Streptomyces sp. NPDC001928 TaxID=3154404 RepID=UPI003318E717
MTMPTTTELRRHTFAPAPRTLVDRVRDLQGSQCGGWALVPLGGRLFDAVITPGGETGSRVIALMDEIEGDGLDAHEPACGPVIEDPDRGWLIWLVPPGTSRRWQPHGVAACLGQPHVLALPPLNRTRPPGVFWRRRLHGDRLVSPAPLYDLFNRLPGPGR